jgi:hypothetical protein
MTLKAVALSILLIGGLSGVAAAQQPRGSQDDQAACEPDVHRLCDQYIPDEAAIVVCLHKEIKHLSPACRKVMERP